MGLVKLAVHVPYHYVYALDELVERGVFASRRDALHYAIRLMLNQLLGPRWTEKYTTYTQQRIVYVCTSCGARFSPDEIIVIEGKPRCPSCWKPLEIKRVEVRKR